MADVKCPSCGKVNPEALEICQFCGTLLKQTRTEPLEPLSPGQFPEKKATADLERTLPGWLRDARRAADEPGTSPIPQPRISQAAPSSTPTPPPVPPKKAPASPLDLLAGLSQAGEEDEEVPDWLKSIQGNAPAAPAAAPTTPEPAPQESTQGWFGELQEQPAETEKPPQPDAWGFSSEPTTFNFDEEEAPPQPAGETPDWLLALQAQETPAPQTPEPPAADFSTPTGVEAVETPDWLASLGGISTDSGPAQPEAKPPQPVPAESSEAPDWLSSLGGFEAPVQPAAGDVPAQTGGDLPDWLADLQGAPAAAAPETPATFETPASGLPDWMSGLQETPSAPAPETPAPATFETSASDLPDWMSGLQETPSAPAPETPAPATFEAPASDLPDWMSGLQETPATTAAETPALEAFETPASDLPDWMSGLPATLTTPATEVSEATTSDLSKGLHGLPKSPVPKAFETPTGEFSDWMSDSQATSAAELPSDADLPDWLSAAMGEKPASAAPPAANAPKRPSKPFPTGALEEIKSLSANEPVPDFMSGLLATGEEKKLSPESTPAAEPGELPDWLAGMAAGVAAASPGAETKAPAESEKPIATEAGAFEFPAGEAEPAPVAPASGETQNIDSLLSMDMPDWLSGFTPQSSETAQPASETPAEDADLRPADLPSWVQAMRPVESMITDTVTSGGASDNEVEKQGPLAGFRSVLPVQADLLEIRKPKAYSIKIQMSETQRGQAALLEKLLASENESKTVAPSRTSFMLRPVRWIVFAVLFVAVLIPAVLGTRAFPAPNVPADPGNPFNIFYDTVNNTIADGAPVLVVTDYQPGFAGEMEQAAVPVITHLMRKNAQLIFLSTSPISTEMGERLVQKGRVFFAENKKDETQVLPAYIFNEQYLFLGYLPGGAAGVKAFAEQPQKTTGVDSVSGDLWQSAMLKDKNITNLSGFAAVLVITDDPDNGRLWIEQTSAPDGTRTFPLLMVTSAQAGPMIQPYAEAGQLTGLVTGLEGGALYENRDAQPGDVYPGHTKALYWDGFGMAVMVAELSILVGVIWSLFQRFRARKDDMEQDEA